MKHLIHVLCQTFAYKNWLLYLIVNTPYCFSACDVHFYPHFEVDQIIHGRMPPKAQQVIDEILMEAFISVTSLSYTDESIHQTRAVRGVCFLSYNAVYVIACINSMQDYAFQAPLLPTFLI